MNLEKVQLEEMSYSLIYTTLSKAMVPNSVCKYDINLNLSCSPSLVSRPSQIKNSKSPISSHIHLKSLLTILLGTPGSTASSNKVLQNYGRRLEKRLNY